LTKRVLCYLFIVLAGLNILCVNYSLYSPYGDDVIIQDGVSRNRPIPYTAAYITKSLLMSEDTTAAAVLPIFSTRYISLPQPSVHSWTLHYMWNVNVRKLQRIF